MPNATFLVYTLRADGSNGIYRDIAVLMRGVLSNFQKLISRCIAHAAVVFAQRQRPKTASEPSAALLSRRSRLVFDSDVVECACDWC
jgi:hypothetical protein